MNLFPNNCPSRFFVKLPEVIKFNVNQVIHVIDLNVPEFVRNDIKSIFLMTNIASQVYVGCNKISVVQRYFVETDILVGYNMNSQYVESNVKEINTDVIEVGILNADSLEYVDFKEGVTYCGFHIQ